MDLKTAAQILHMAAVIMGRAAGKVGGKSRSPRKVAAARLNGKLGGRPRKAKGAAAVKGEGETRGETS